MRSRLRAHRRQFVLGPDRTGPEGWRHRPLGSLWLSHCPDLPVETITDADGRAWMLLGRALPTAPGDPTPALGAAAAPTKVLETLHHTWAGRWVLMSETAVEMDACGLLGCYVGSDESATWTSSSPALLRDLVDPGRVDRRRLVAEVGIAWHVPPRSSFERVRRLLVGERLDPRTGERTARHVLPPIDPTVAPDDVETAIVEHVATTLRVLAGQQPLSLGLTAGYDSRLVLAVAMREGIEVTTFTRIAERSSAADRLLPPALAEAARVPHRFIRPGRRDQSELAVVREHTAGSAAPGDLLPLLQRTRRDVEGFGVGGHGFAAASGFGRLRRLPSEPGDPDDAAAALAEVLGEPAGSSAVDGLREWLGWVVAHPVAHYDWRDRFFLEQRQAGWLSAKEQAYDLAPPERVPILNGARLYALLLGVAPEARLGSRLQAKIVADLAPELGAIPFNPSNRELGWARAARAKLADDPLHALKWAGRGVRRRARARFGTVHSTRYDDPDHDHGHAP